MWQNQYNPTHPTVTKLLRILLPDLENIKQVMVKKQNEKLKERVRLAQPILMPRVFPREKCLGA
jgi:hypothetical protein